MDLEDLRRTIKNIQYKRRKTSLSREESGPISDKKQELARLDDLLSQLSSRLKTVTSDAKMAKATVSQENAVSTNRLV